MAKKDLCQYRSRLNYWMVKCVMKKAAVIILYNPNEERLLLNVEAVVSQVDKLIFVDNGNSKGNIKEIINKFDVEYINNHGNKGIAYALNRAIEYCIANGFDWLLTLDQDSICPSGLVRSYEKYIEKEHVALITCSINYNNQECLASKCEWNYVDECITSAAFTNVAICKSLGGFDEAMFIDRVDFEYCYRLRKNGYKIVRANDVVMDHQLGELQVINGALKKIHVGNHNAFRKYYMAQNIVYCMRKHPDICTLSKSTSKLFILWIKTIVFERKKIEKTKQIIKGIRSGTSMKISQDNWIT